MELILIQHWLAGFGHVINLSVEIMAKYQVFAVLARTPTVAIAASTDR